MSKKKLRSTKIEFQDALSFFYERLMPIMSPQEDNLSRELFESGRLNLIEAQKSFNKASMGDQNIIKSADDLIWSMMLLANFFPPLDEELHAIKQECNRSMRQESTILARKSRSEKKAARQQLLKSTYGDKLKLFITTKDCNSIVEEFCEKCRDNNIDCVSGRSLYRDIQDILSECQNNS